ncbi:MAG TPA: nucleoside-diphosphate sugar epimerase/dehydratase [Acidimicrobiales bacterium]|nr:nucleoside-diphosphate sugar epimerase/dehydratase [Acidimicrobiales bacterium]
MRGDVMLGALDAVLIAAAFAAVLVLRFDFRVPNHHWRQFWRFLPVGLAVSLAANWAWGLYGQLWRHASIHEARRLLLAGATTSAVLVGLELGVRRSVPYSVITLGVGLGTFLCGALRFQSRLFSFQRRSADGPGLRVVVIGSADAGAALVREMQHSPRAGLVPVAVLDVDPRRHGRSFLGLRIEGGIDDLPAVARRTDAHQAVLAMSSVDQATVRQAAAAAEEAGVALKIAPGMATTVGNRVSIRDVRDLRIEDLLGRKQVVTDLDGVRRLLEGKRVLVTGAGGSIGSEISRQVSACDPAALVLLDHDETHLHDTATTVHGGCHQVLADIRDRGLMLHVFAEYRPEIVFHAAAHKHVPLLEAHPCEAAATNVLGTANVLEAAEGVGVEGLVFISTDKAVVPSSVMGASKRVGEQLVLEKAPEGARYCAVRFGNVLGSRGSVVPTFMRQIAAGGPVTVTDPAMTRFFMSIEEAVQLVLQAAALAKGGELFMLDMGEPVRILDLAERMIRLSGREVGKDIEIRVTGVRPGEKLVEELRDSDEEAFPTIHPSIMRVQPLPTPTHLLGMGLVELEAFTSGRRPDEVRALMFALAEARVRLDHEAATGEHEVLRW